MVKIAPWDWSSLRKRLNTIDPLCSVAFAFVAPVLAPIEALSGGELDPPQAATAAVSAPMAAACTVSCLMDMRGRSRALLTTRSQHAGA